MAGRPVGAQNKDKPFREALRMEIAAVKDGDPKSLRAIARALLTVAASGEVQAIKEVADRLDGKPAQESTVTVDDKRDATDWSRSELVAFLSNAGTGGARTTEKEGRARKSDKVH